MRTSDRSAPSHSLAAPRSLGRRLIGPALAAVVAGVALLASPAPAAAQSAPKFAVIDVRRAVLETEEGLRVSANLKKLFDSRQIEIENKQRALGQEKEDLEREAQAGKTPKEALQRKAESFQKRLAEFQGLTVDYQREMQRKESEMTTPIVQRVLAIVRRIAAQDGYEMVLEKSAVPYFRADLEVTDRAIQMYNSGQAGDAAPPASPGKPPAAPPATTAPGKEPAKPAPAPAKPAPAKPAAPPAKK